MKRFANWIFLICLLFNSCGVDTSKEQIEKLKSEIVNTEHDFAEMAKKEGVSKAFLTFAAEDAVLSRDNTVLKGKKAIKAHFESQTLKEIKLEWEPDFVDVASSGDLGYTYGHYSFSAIDTSGKNIKTEGVFHTVWKKQSDGNWRFVWD